MDIKQKERNQKYYELNRDKALTRAEEYRQEHREELKLKQREIRRINNNICIDCGKLISPHALRCGSCASKISNQPRKRVYYCLDCGIVVSGAISIRCKKCASEWQRGENHPNWKGGRRISSEGYVLIWKPDHPRAFKNLVLEHILVLEKKLGRSLSPNEIGHHLNGIKTDNRPKNLVALTSKKHYLVLAVKAKRIQELEALLNNQGQLV